MIETCGKTPKGQHHFIAFKDSFVMIVTIDNLMHSSILPTDLPSVVCTVRTSTVKSIIRIVTY